MIKEILYLFLITLVPAIELRGSIPYGILFTDLHWFAVFIICLISNIILGVVFYLLIDFLLKYIILKIPFMHKLWKKYIARLQKKAEKPVERYGAWAVAFFIAIPLPGSGSISGGIIAYLFGLEKKKFFLANALGVFVAAILVTAIVLSGSSLFGVLH